MPQQNIFFVEPKQGKTFEIVPHCISSINAYANIQKYSLRRCGRVKSETVIMPFE